MIRLPTPRRVVAVVAGYALVAAVLQLLADGVLLALHGYVTRSSLVDTWLLPVRILTHPLDPASAYGVHADALRMPLYLTLVIGGLVFTWVTLLRHGYANPLTAGKSDLELPLARQLTPRLKNLGIWVRHDAALGDKRASWRDRFQVSVLKKFAVNRDLARAVTRRANGMLVPYSGEQPDARIFLGTYRHLHLLRKRKYNVYARPGQHVVIFGPSGAGKGATQMNPSLLFWNGVTEGSPDGSGTGWPGAIITSTVKSDHVDTALEWRLSLSDECYVYDPLQLYPEYRNFWVGWNPLGTVNSFAEANSVATALMESESQQSGGGGENADYFRAQALMVLAPMILSASLSNAAFRDVYDWALRLESEVADPNVVNDKGDVDPSSRTYAVMDKLYEYAERTGDETPLNQMQQVFAKDPREASGVWGSVRKTLQPYNDEKSVMSTDQALMPRMLDPRKFYSTPHATLFIIAPEVANEAKRMRPVFAAFITWLIEEAQKLSREKNGKLPYPVLANLDEVKNVGAIPGLAHTLSLTRSIGFFVKHAWQDEAQIASAYGKDDAKTITSNSRTWVVLPGVSDPDHLEALARLIGERPVKRRSKKDSGDADNGARMKAASASMVKEVKDDEVLILTDNLPPFVIKATRYFQDPVMLARYKMGDTRRDTGIPPDPNALRGSRRVSLESNARDMSAPALGERLTPGASLPGLADYVSPSMPEPLPTFTPLPTLGSLGTPTPPAFAPDPWLPTSAPARPESRDADLVSSAPYDSFAPVSQRVLPDDVPAGQEPADSAPSRFPAPAPRPEAGPPAGLLDRLQSGSGLAGYDTPLGEPGPLDDPAPFPSVLPTAAAATSAGDAPAPDPRAWEEFLARVQPATPATPAAPEPDDNACPACGQEFSTDGLDAAQRDMVISRHLFAAHGVVPTPAGPQAGEAHDTSLEDMFAETDPHPVAHPPLGQQWTTPDLP